jgi:hypothetical protein
MQKVFEKDLTLIDRVWRVDNKQRKVSIKSVVAITGPIAL